MGRKTKINWRTRGLGPVALCGRSGELHDSPVVQRTLRLVEAVKQAGGFRVLGVADDWNGQALHDLDKRVR